MADFHKEKFENRPIVVGSLRKVEAKNDCFDRDDHGVHLKDISKPQGQQAMVEITGRLDKVTIEKITNLGGTIKEGKILIKADKTDEVKKLFLSNQKH